MGAGKKVCGKNCESIRLDFLAGVIPVYFFIYSLLLLLYLPFCRDSKAGLHSGGLNLCLSDQSSGYIDLFLTIAAKSVNFLCEKCILKSINVS